MKLPSEIFTNEQSYQDLELKFCKKTIRIRKYLTREIKNYLNATSTVDDDWTWNNEAFKLFKACVHPDDQKIIQDISKADFLFGLSYLRSMSYDPTIQKPHYCPHCHWAYDAYTISILDHVVTEPAVIEQSFSVNTDNGDVLYFKQIPYTKELEIIKNKSEDNYMEVANQVLYNSIDKIIIDGKSYENIDIDQIIKYIDERLGIKEYTNILNIITDKKINFFIKENKTCASCNKEYHVIIDEPYFFVQV